MNNLILQLLKPLSMHLLELHQQGLYKKYNLSQSPEDPALEEVLHCIQLKDANTVLLNQQSSEQCSDAMVSQY